MFRGGHKNKKIHLLRLAVMTAFLSLCLSGCAMTHSMKTGKEVLKQMQTVWLYTAPILWILLIPLCLNLRLRQGFQCRCVLGGPENF